MAGGGEYKPILRLRKLCKDFQSGGFREKLSRVIDSVDMEINAGEIRGIVGESGAGKSTLARCSLRLIDSSSGSVQFDGEELTSLSPSALRARRKDFQMVFQDAYASLNPAMTVKQILMEPLQIHGIGDNDSRLQQVRESLDSVSLSESLMNRRPGELSGGQQQRVGIARGLILKPRLLIADEPVSSLDASVQAQILNLMAELKKRNGHTLVLISHSLSAIHYLCTHVSVLYKGRLIEEAPAEVFFGKPRHPYSKALLDATLVLNLQKGPRIRSARSHHPSLPLPESGCAFHPYCSQTLPVCGMKVPSLSKVGMDGTVACFLYSPASH